MIKRLFGNVLKGMGVGLSMLIPGVSGGTIAIILGIYDDLISAISSFTKNIKKNSLLLGTFFIGVGLGMFLLADVMLFITKNYHTTAMYFFLGAIAASLPMLFKKAKMDKLGKKLSLYYSLYAVIGILIVWLIALIPTGIFKYDEGNPVLSIIMLLVAGFLFSIALILPGISGTFMLLMLGMYESTIIAVKDFDLLYLVPLIVGGLIGTVATTKALENAMKNHTQITYMVIMGFVVASMFDVVPKLIPIGLDIVACVIAFTAGFFAISLISRKRKQ